MADTTGTATSAQRKGAENSPRTEPTVEAATKASKIVELRRARLSWPEIAKIVGMSPAAARNKYRETLAKIPAQSVDEHRAEELVLYDDAVADLMLIARDPSASHRSRIEAWSIIRAWCERKAKLLGLDAPQQTITVDLVDSEIAKLTSEIAKIESFSGEGGS